MAILQTWRILGGSRSWLSKEFSSQSSAGELQRPEGVLGKHPDLISCHVGRQAGCDPSFDLLQRKQPSSTWVKSILIGWEVWEPASKGCLLVIYKVSLPLSTLANTPILLQDCQHGCLAQYKAAKIGSRSASFDLADITCLSKDSKRRANRVPIPKTSWSRALTWSKCTTPLVPLWRRKYRGWRPNPGCCCQSSYDKSKTALVADQAIPTEREKRTISSPHVLHPRLGTRYQSEGVRVLTRTKLTQVGAQLRALWGRHHPGSPAAGDSGPPAGPWAVVHRRGSLTFDVQIPDP